MHEYLQGRRDTTLLDGGGNIAAVRGCRAGRAATILVTCVRCSRLHEPPDLLELHPTCAACTTKSQGAGSARRRPDQAL